MEIEQKETDCKCENSTGWTTIKCCNICGKSVEPFWRVDSENKTQSIIGIEEKEVERINNYYNGSLMDEEHRDYAKLGARTEHLHLQKEVIQPLRDEIFDLKSEWEVCPSCKGDIRGICTDCYNTRRIPNQSQIQSQKEQITKLEAEIKALGEALVKAYRWLRPDFMESENRTFIDDMIMIRQLLKNEG